MRVLFAISLLAFSGPALARDGHLADIPPGDTRGGDTAGGLTPHDVAGKRLLDANGNEIGHIAGADRSGNATVRMRNGHRTTVPMAQLSKGTGPNTIIESAGSGAQRLNRVEAGPPPVPQAPLPSPAGMTPAPGPTP